MFGDLEAAWLLVGAAVLIVLRLGMQWTLSSLNARHVRAHAGSVPAAWAGRIDAETYARSGRYTLEQLRLGRVEALWEAVVLAAVLFSGLLPALWGWGTSALGTGPWGQAGTLAGILVLLSFLSLPLEYYEQFRLEARWGFNKSSLGLWVSDKLKGLVLGLLLGVPLLALILWLMQSLSLWWLWAWGIVLAFQLVMAIVFPLFIMPLFNRFEPLPEGDLRARLFALAQRTGFRARTILVMDGSKRSGHSNAFFAGLGKWRRIVLFDTLIDQLRAEQLEAVLAHEIGHNKLGHIPKMLGLAAVGLLVGFAVLGWLAAQPGFVTAFGFDAASGLLGPALLLFSLMSGLVSYWLSPLFNRLSRTHEYEADAFAREAMQGAAEPLQEALRVLSEKNLSNLTPHPLYSAFYYSHPSLLERERALTAPA